jgi:ABC-type antimicrobial peptide transport system permease subunit
METPAILIESLIERAETYGKTTFELSKLKALETSTLITTSLVSRLSVIIMFSMFAVVLSIAVALLLGELLGKLFYGFFIIAIFYLIAGMLLRSFLYKWIKKPLSDLIIKQVLK